MKEEKKSGQTSKGGGGQTGEEMEPPHPSYAQNDDSNKTEPREATSGRGAGGQGPVGARKSLDQSGSWSTAGVAGLVALFLLVIGGGGVMAYMNFAGNSASNPPSVASIYNAHKSIDSLRYDFSVDGKLALNESELRGRDDFERFKQILPYIPNTGNVGEVPEQLQLEASLGGLVNSPNQNSGSKTTMQLAAGGNKTENLIDIEFRLVGDAGYVNPKVLPTVPMMPLDSFENQWFSFTASPTPVQFADAKESISDSELSDETTIEVMKALTSSGLVSVDDVSETTLSDGSGAYKYTLSVHPQNLPAFKEQFEEIVSENQPELAQQEDIQQALDEIGTSTDSSDTISKTIKPVTMWLGKDSYRLQKARFEKTYSKQDLIEATGSSSDRANMAGFDSATVSFTLNLSDYNQNFDVQKPTDATPFEEAKESLPFFGAMAGARQSARDARRQTDINQIETGLALYKDENGSYPDSLYGGSNSLAASDQMTEVPSDPSEDSKYLYTTSTSEGGYCIGTTLEDTSSLPSDNDKQCIDDLKAATGQEDVNYSVGN
jgi:hypothetical protein